MCNVNYILVWLHAYIYMYVYIHMCSYAYECEFKHIHVRKCVCFFVYICVCVYVCKYVCIHVCIYGNLLVWQSQRVNSSTVFVCGSCLLKNAFFLRCRFILNISTQDENYKDRWFNVMNENFWNSSHYCLERQFKIKPGAVLHNKLTGRYRRTETILRINV